jgi:PIN domain nuclease of toxin-antitoxin system
MLIGDLGNDLFFSAISIWEIAIKQALGKPGFDIPAREVRRGLLENGYREVALTGAHGIAVESLPLLHGDPFDRALIAQAMVEDLTLLTSDKKVAQYPGPILKV